MKQLILNVLLFIISNTIFAQAPTIEWQKSFGGSADETINSAQLTADGGYVLAGYTQSTDGDLISNTISNAGWLVKIDQEGNMQWQQTYALGNINAVQQTTDGGFIIGGGDNAIKLSSTGAIQWQQTYSLGNINVVQQTIDNGYIIATSQSYVAKTSSNGTIQWQQLLGDSNGGILADIQRTNDGGYIVAGRKFDEYESQKRWVVKLNATGSIQWQTFIDNYDYSLGSWLNAVRQRPNGNYIFSGGNNWNDDDQMYEVIKLDDTGGFQQFQDFCSSTYNEAKSIQNTMDNGYIVAGLNRDNYSSNDTSAIEGYHIGIDSSVNSWEYTVMPSSDALIVKVDSNGNTQWLKDFGGSGNECGNTILNTADGGYLIAGYSNTPNDGDVTGNHGGYDFWVVKLAGNSTAINNISNKQNASAFPNPFKNELNIKPNIKFNTAKIIDMYGRTLLITKEHHINTSSFPVGIYLLKIDNRFSIRIAKY